MTLVIHGKCIQLFSSSSSGDDSSWFSHRSLFCCWIDHADRNTFALLHLNSLSSLCPFTLCYNPLCEFPVRAYESGLVRDSSSLRYMCTLDLKFPYIGQNQFLKHYLLETTQKTLSNKTITKVVFVEEKKSLVQGTNHSSYSLKVFIAGGRRSGSVSMESAHPSERLVQSLSLPQVSYTTRHVI